MGEIEKTTNIETVPILAVDIPTRGKSANNRQTVLKQYELLLDEINCIVISVQSRPSVRNVRCCSKPSRP